MIAFQLRTKSNMNITTSRLNVIEYWLIVFLEVICKYPDTFFFYSFLSQKCIWRTFHRTLFGGSSKWEENLQPK